LSAGGINRRAQARIASPGIIWLLLKRKTVPSQNKMIVEIISPFALTFKIPFH